MRPGSSLAAAVLERSDNSAELPHTCSAMMLMEPSENVCVAAAFAEHAPRAAQACVGKKLRNPWLCAFH